LPKVAAVSAVVLCSCDSTTFAGSVATTYRAAGCGVTSQALEATATFQIDADMLTVTLTNSSLADVEKPAELLVGVYFDLAGNPELTPVGAYLGSGSTVLFAPTADANGVPLEGGAYPGGDVGAEWAYNPNLCGIPGGPTYGISSWGMGGVYGNPNRFDTAGNLQGPKGPDGPQYGITSAGDDPLTGNPEVTGQEGDALIQNEVSFVFTGLPFGFSLGRISNVSFQYQSVTILRGEPVAGSVVPTLIDCTCAGPDHHD
jgi:hypothetical protein